jgi:hypothetical protein
MARKRRDPRWIAQPSSGEVVPALAAGTGSVERHRAGRRVVVMPGHRAAAGPGVAGPAQRRERIPRVHHRHRRRTVVPKPVRGTHRAGYRPETPLSPTSSPCPTPASPPRQDPGDPPTHRDARLKQTPPSTSSTGALRRMNRRQRATHATARHRKPPIQPSDRPTRPCRSILMRSTGGICRERPRPRADRARPQRRDQG